MMGLSQTSAIAGRGVTRTRAVCAVLRFETNVGKDEDFEALMSDLAYRVSIDEDGCTSYVLTRMIGSRRHFAVHARFADLNAFNAHAETEHLTQLMPRLTALLAAPIAIEIFYEV